MGYNKAEIEYYLKNKISELKKYIGVTVNSVITDQFEKHAIISGGAIVSLLLGEEPNDIDIWFDDVDVCKDVVSHINIASFNLAYDIAIEKYSSGIP